MLLNGRQVVETVRQTGLAHLQEAGRLNHGTVSCTLFAGEGSGVRFLGWSTNLQSSFGVTREFRSRLAAWLRDAERENETDAKASLPADLVGSFHEEGHIRKGVTVSGKAALRGLLEAWLRASNAATIGDVGAFGGSGCVYIELDGVTAVLNADTKRSAVEAYVRDARARGGEAPWSVVPNRRGRVNKVNFREDGADTPGWYCYLREPLAEPGVI